MKLICFRSLESKGASSEVPQKNINKVNICKVVKFEDCEAANKEFASQIMETLNTKNQYLATLAG